MANCTVWLAMMIVTAQIAHVMVARGEQQQEQQEGMALVEVLRDLRQAITDDPLHVLDSWDLTDDVTNGSSVDPCIKTPEYNWTGLQCNAQGELVGISLSNKQLQGSITPSLSFLPLSITFLDLSLNNFSSSFSSSLFPPSLSSLNLSHNSLRGLLSFDHNQTATLQHLFLDHNQFSGPLSLPPACLPRLLTLSLDHNNFAGPLPPSLSSCSSLRYLDLSFNSLDGTLGSPPTLWTNLSSLTHLDVMNNSLHGSIPPSLGNCSNLQYLDLSYNYFSGPIPPSLPQGCRNLTFLRILYTYTMSGPIPPEFGLLSHLDTLWLEGNNFSGKVLDVAVNCSQLTILDIFGNRFEGRLADDFGSRLPKLVKLIVMMNAFTGSIPASLSNCTSLTNLELGFNALSGQVPGVILGQCVQIQRLDLQHNNLTGSISPQIGNLTKMPFLILNNNSFTGSLPEELGLLASLEGVTFQFNLFSGSIPAQIFNCSKLQHLLLQNNHLQGPIPSSISQTPNLELLYADNNMLTGALPDGLWKNTRMQNLTLSNNGLTGGIPTFLSSSFLLLDLSHNRFSGSVPVGFGRMQELETLDLSNNRLSGPIPSDLDECVGLVTLNLAANTLVGGIDPSLGVYLQSLVELNLSHNTMTGSIPPELGRLRHIRSLDLSWNNLTGEIPPALSTVQSLALLDLSYNHLEGAVPEGGVFKNASLLGNPGLCGAILGKSCPASSSNLALKVGLACGAAFVFILAMIILVILIHRRRTSSRFQPLDIHSKLLKLKLVDIERATDNFHSKNIVGKGGSGLVYKGMMPDGQVLAFKKFTVESSAVRSFFREVHSLGAIRHRNLIRVLGYCSNRLDVHILILEYMENGNLDDLLHNKTNHGNLTWEARRQVAVDVAQGLLYLHKDCPNSPIIHCDIKPSNILFDSHMGVHISDFGLAKAFVQHGFSSTQHLLHGTLGYMAPECAIDGGISPKCDVYSYGVLVLEMMSARKPIDKSFQEGTTIATWVKSKIDTGNLVDILDDKLRPEYDAQGEHMQALTRLAMHCVEENPRNRPTIEQVVAILMHASSQPPQSSSHHVGYQSRFDF